MSKRLLKRLSSCFKRRSVRNYRESSGAIGVAGLLRGGLSLSGDGDVVVVVSGRNADEEAFRGWIDVPALERA